MADISNIVLVWTFQAVQINVHVLSRHSEERRCQTTFSCVLSTLYSSVVFSSCSNSLSVHTYNSPFCWTTVVIVELLPLFFWLLLIGQHVLMLNGCITNGCMACFGVPWRHLTACIFSWIRKIFFGNTVCARRFSFHSEVEKNVFLKMPTYVQTRP